MIRKEGSKYTVKSEAGKPMGSYDSKGEAKKRLGQIEYFKHRGGKGGLAVWAQRNKASKPFAPKGGAADGQPSALGTWVTRSSGKELPVPDVLQKTDYTCGPASLLACAEYFMPDMPLTEEEVSALAGTTDDGTPPEGLHEAATALGLDSEVREGMTVQDLEDLLGQGALVIVALQAWANDDGSLPPEGYDNRWMDGHYVVCTGVDGDRLYFEDPSVEVARATLSPDELNRRWHDVDSGIQRQGIGVVIRGQRAPVQTPVGEQVKMG